MAPVDQRGRGQLYPRRRPPIYLRMHSDGPTANPGSEPGPVEFDAILRPHRSLGPTGFLILMSLVATVGFAAGVTFLLIGAWPVFGFCGLEVVLLYVCFRLNYRGGRCFERIRL